MPRSEHRRRGLIAAGAVLLAAPVLAGTPGYATCAACHGASGEGNAAVGAPPIAGQSAAYVERQLQAFATGGRGAGAGDRNGATMRAAVATLKDDAARRAVAAEVARLKPRAARAAVGDNVNGRNYFNALCSACHGADAHGNEVLGAPRLAGMPRDYLARQLAAFRGGSRGAGAGDRLGAQMRSIANMLPDARTADDVLAYVGTLAP